MNRVLLVVLGFWK